MASGSAIDIRLENTYEYRNKRYNDFNEISDILNFNLNTVRDLRSYDKDVEATLKYAKEIAQQFVDSMHPTNPGGRYQTTRNLRGSISYDMSTTNGGNGGRLFANAKDYRGRPYAGHIEYGYTDRGGNPRGPWPFLRPAMRLAASATRYDFARTMEDLMFGNYRDGSITIGSKNARQSVANLYGSTRAATSTIRDSFQSYYDQAYGGGRWGDATNGIGFASGEYSGYTTTSWGWSDGSL